MVTTAGRSWTRAGKSRAGCLISILVLAVLVYSGVAIGKVYYRYWRLLDEMKTQARMAPGINDEVILRRLLAEIEQLNLPEQARRITIRRTERPREILITTSYPDTVVFPLYKYALQLNLKARQRL